VSFPGAPTALARVLLAASVPSALGKRPRNPGAPREPCGAPGASPAAPSATAKPSPAPQDNLHQQEQQQGKEEQQQQQQGHQAAAAAAAEVPPTFASAGTGGAPLGEATGPGVPRTDPTPVASLEKGAPGEGAGAVPEGGAPAGTGWRKCQPVTTEGQAFSEWGQAVSEGGQAGSDLGQAGQGTPGPTQCQWICSSWGVRRLRQWSAAGAGAWCASAVSSSKICGHGELLKWRSCPASDLSLRTLRKAAARHKRGE